MSSLNFKKQRRHSTFSIYMHTLVITCIILYDLQKQPLCPHKKVEMPLKLFCIPVTLYEVYTMDLILLPRTYLTLPKSTLANRRKVTIQRPTETTYKLIIPEFSV